ETMNRAEAMKLRCSGDRLWLGGAAMNEEGCDAELKLLVRSASNAYFGQVVSALRLPPPDPDPLLVRLREVWDKVQRAELVDDVRTLGRMLPQVASAIEGADPAVVLALIEAERDAASESAARPLRSEEFERITSAPLEAPGIVPERGAEFAAYRVPRSRVTLPAGV